MKGSQKPICWLSYLGTLFLKTLYYYYLFQMWPFSYSLLFQMTDTNKNQKAFWMNYLLLCFILSPSCFSFFFSQLFFFFVVQKRIMLMIPYDVFFVYLKKFCKYGVLFRGVEITENYFFSMDPISIVLWSTVKLETRHWLLYIFLIYLI